MVLGEKLRFLVVLHEKPRKNLGFAAKTVFSLFVHLPNAFPGSELTPGDLLGPIFGRFFTTFLCFSHRLHTKTMIFCGVCASPT